MSFNLAYLIQMAYNLSIKYPLHEHTRYMVDQLNEL